MQRNKLKMKKYAKIINEETKACEVGLGTNTAFYSSIGMTEMEVEQAYDGGWYLKGYAQKKPDEVKEQEVRAIRNQYLETYVDPKQLVMVWNSLSAEEQELYKDYRQYLLDYPQTEGWYEQNPDDLKTFAEKRRKATETIK
jgi:hypothetical protein